MWKTFLVWAMKFALQQLGADVDAETQKQVDDYERRRVALEDLEKEKTLEIQRLDAKVADLEIKRYQKADESARLEMDVFKLDLQLKEIENEKNKKLADLQSLDDDTLLRSEL